MKCLIFSSGLMRLFSIFKQWWTIKTQSWKQIDTACYFVTVLKWPSLEQLALFNRTENNHWHTKQFSGDIWGGGKRSVAAAAPRNKADILGWKQFDQLKPQHAVCHVQKSPKIHAKVLNILQKASKLCKFSVLVSRYSEEKRWVRIFEELRLANGNGIN